MKVRLILVAGLMALTGCGAGDGAPSDAGAPLSPAADSASQEYSDADVMFLQMMVAHNEQGIEIVKMARDRPVREELKVLAIAIESTQQAEAQDMRGWLRSWGKPETTDKDPSAHAHHGGSGLSKEAALETLKKASDTDFQRDFIATLSGHQGAGAELAKPEQTDGRFAKAKDIARRIYESRTAQVSQLLQLNT